MPKTRIYRSTTRFLSAQHAGMCLLGASLLLVASSPAAAQAANLQRATLELPSAASSSTAAAEVPLPDAPDANLSSSSAAAPAGAFAAEPNPPHTLSEAGPYAMIIQPGQSAPRVTPGQQVVAGIKDSFSPIAAVGWVISAGYTYAVNGSPNYPQTGKGFAQQLGASAARATSENLFTEAILAPVLREDARYYRMGSGHNFVKRLVYAGTRPLLTKTIGGRQTLNIANLGGNLAGAALTQAYYPPLNQGFSQVLQTFGGSVGGSAFGFVAEEFLPAFHFHHHD